MGVSVIIPAFNAESFVATAIRCALDQTRPPLEIIVVDDGSSDRTAEIASAFGEPVRVLRKPNGGPASARNFGARQALGDWLAMLDADDWWEPTKLEKQLSLADNLGVGIIHTLANSSRPGVPAEITFADLWERNWIINSSAIVRRIAFEAVGGCVEDKAVLGAEDYNLWLRLAAEGWRILTCGETLTHYTRGGEGLSANLERVLAGELENARQIALQTRLSEMELLRKEIKIYMQIGNSAFHSRRMSTARAALATAVRREPTLYGATRLLSAYAPQSLLNLRRRVLRKASTSLASVKANSGRSQFGSAKPETAQFGSGAPYLSIIVDAEEEFDWSAGPGRSISVRSMREQEAAQRIFERFRIVPTYAADYAVAAQPDGYKPLLEFLVDKRCEIGAQLHPWINPPLDEPLSLHNSFPGNLPEALEFEKLQILTLTIENNFGRRPILYRAGRYGAGPATAAALDKLGYRIDCSVVPYHDFRPKQGPDYRAAPESPYWFGPANNILEIPVTVGITGGAASPLSGRLPIYDNELSHKFRLPGILARLGVVNRIRLTPEGVSLEEAKHMTRVGVRRDHRRVFVLSYHSPSLSPGNTPYVRSAADRQHFLDWIEAYLEFFFGEIGGLPTTPGFLLGEAIAARPQRASSTNVIARNDDLAVQLT